MVKVDECQIADKNDLYFDVFCQGSPQYASFGIKSKNFFNGKNVQLNFIALN